MSCVYVVPGATIAVPLASPSGISPTGLCVKRSSSCACDIFSISGTVTAIKLKPGFNQIIRRSVNEIERKALSFVVIVDCLWGGRADEGQLGLILVFAKEVWSPSESNRHDEFEA